MIKIKDLEIGNVIELFASIHKVLYIGRDYIISLYYERSHKVANPVIIGFDELAKLLSEDPCKVYKESEYNENYIFEELTLPTGCNSLLFE